MTYSRTTRVRCGAFDGIADAIEPIDGWLRDAGAMRMRDGRSMCYTDAMEELTAIKRLLAEAMHKPNRALGQNFLCDEAVIDRILDAAGIDGARVVEIGPGLGALTKPLLLRAAQVVAVEKDAALAEQLGKLLPDERLTVVTGDFLDVDLTVLTGAQPWHAVGNLPYYVTTPIVEKLLVSGPLSITLMVQAEAAERFFAAPGARVYGPVAVMSQYLYAPEHVCDVPRNCFYPQPEVDSRVVHLSRRMERSLDAAAFLRFLKHAFAMRRKTLRNNLSSMSGFDAALMTLGLPAGVRAEAVAPETLARLYTMYAADCARAT